MSVKKIVTRKWKNCEKRDFIALHIKKITERQLDLNCCVAFKLTLGELRKLTKTECGGDIFRLPTLELLRAIRGDSHLKEHYSLSGFAGEEAVTFYSKEVMLAVSQVEDAVKERRFKLRLVV
jgi:hypothetical protein